MQFPPVCTLFAPARLRTAPSGEDQRQLSRALDRIEEAYAFAPQGVVTFLSYGLPRNQAALDLQHKFHIAATDHGLERFITATRRQNFLIRPPRHRAFPLAELGRERRG